MNNQYFITLNLEEKRIVVVGGGAVAERKIHKLIEAGGDVMVISPSITNVIQHWSNENQLEWKQKSFDINDIQDAFLVIAATNEKAVNLQIYNAATKNQLISLVDNPKRSNFTIPSSFHRGKLSISVSTAGASPGLSKKIADDLKNQFDDVYEEYLEFLYEWRLKIKSQVQDPKLRKHLLKKLLEPEFFEMTSKKEYAERDKHFLELYSKRGEYQ